jgi:CubicO group peptidase (beta-lactamase class C family)
MKHLFPKSILILITAGSLLGAAAPSRAAHPEVLVTDADRVAVTEKIAHAPWAQASYETLKARVDKYVALCQTDPHFMSSRLCMNWNTHYTVPITKKQKWVGGEGHAPVPTPRFAGARDWATKYGAPADLAAVKPYNDQDGKIWLVNNETHQGEWVEPSLTGRTIETINERIIQSAADAGFLHWVTGDEKYARYASEILWTYMEGFSYVQSPRYDAGDKGTAAIIGMTSFEVIHENVMLPLSESYDFLYSYLKTNGKDVGLIQKQLQRMSDRVVAGGSSEGNWNLNQAMMIAYGGLALEDDARYPDHHGRQYYVDVVLNADLPTQRGVARVIHTGYDQTTALWPEAPGYGFGTTGQIMQIVSLMNAEPSGRAVLDDPFMTRAIFAQSELIYPNGFSVGLGDTDNTRLNAMALELMIAAARRRGDTETEIRLTSALRREMDSGNYNRSSQDNIFALTQYVAQLKDAPPAGSELGRTYSAPALDILMQRNLADPAHSLVAAMYGTNGGHIHVNGLAMELYGAGLIQGADPGRGASYWTADHGEYYSQPPAHNTVIVNGKSSYPGYGAGHQRMSVEPMEPQPGRAGISPNIGYTQSGFHYASPIAAGQQRTLALVRTGAQSGFYFDVFRSRADQDAGSFHDYLYHNIGQSLTVSDPAASLLALSPTQLLSNTELLKGYKYFQNEKSLEMNGVIHGVFATQMPDQSRYGMDLWMLGQSGRRVFSVDAPSDHAARPSLPAVFQQTPMPTMIVRQTGEAWKRPFIAVYEPYLGSEGAKIRTVHAARTEDQSSLAACVVEGRTAGAGASEGFKAILLQNDAPARSSKAEGYTFAGTFGSVLTKSGRLSEIYLGHGKTLGDARFFVTASGANPTDADLRRDGDGWRYTSSDPIKVGLEFALPAGDVAKRRWTIMREDAQSKQAVVDAKIRVEKSANGIVAVVTCDLAPGHDARLSLVPAADTLKAAHAVSDFSPVTAQIESWVSKGYYPGASLIVYKDAKLVYEKYFGTYKPETVAFIASAGKWLAAATIASVVDEGKLSWDDPVSKWLPQFTDSKGKATLRQLLSHTSGYPDYQPKGAPVDNYQTLTESVAHIQPLPADTDPGTHFHYGGLAMQVAGRMTELATGKDWETLFQERIAKPLGMTATHFTPVDNGGGHSPMLGGGARASLGDYGKFLQMISGNGVFEGKRILSAKAIREMQADQVRGAAVEPGAEYVEKARGETYSGIYGLGEWREKLNARGAAVLISSPSWAGAYPWIDKEHGVYGFFLAHVDGGPAGRDHFNSFYASPILPMLVGQAIDRASSDPALKVKAAGGKL